MADFHVVSLDVCFELPQVSSLVSVKFSGYDTHILMLDSGRPIILKMNVTINESLLQATKLTCGGIWSDEKAVSSCT
jgi:hypothetical protein